MTDRNSSLYDEVAATDVGAQSLAAADLAGQVMRLLEQAVREAGVDQKTLASRLGVTEGRVSQVLNGDGNLRVAAVGRYLRALGYEVTLSAKPVDGDGEDLPKRRSRSETKNPAGAEWRGILAGDLTDVGLARSYTTAMEIGLPMASLRCSELSMTVVDGNWGNFDAFGMEVADYR
ncbi:helix-turn-helix domain-containing protein [Gordonia aquimaris]|uniref:Helix-turn-helix domain-containing protein n=1 Tax=Gordonia aquimaris TaxID=2984863 RepID=A0A9X3I618_9ACTN|nr:helix-turn-helix domain-containing protein [Gordonia aquimaris]MCX2965610.1 helix-turn-helix domain-containing protein [Gordonia aquimaris]